MAVKLTEQNVLEVSQMDESTARQLLRNRLVDQRLVDAVDDTTTLLEQLPFLPSTIVQAIVQAAVYINENGITFSEYLSLLAEQEEDAIILLRKTSRTKEDTGMHNSLAADSLSFMACIDLRDILRSLIPAGSSRKKETDALGTLDAYSFIKRLGGQAFDLHQDVFPNYEHSNRTMWRTLLTHVLYAVKSDILDAAKAKRTNLTWRYGMCLYSDGHYDEAESQILEVFETRKQTLGPEHPDTLTSMANLALMNWKQSQK
ncbi:hypothetical protein DL98DRAFT_595871 [Cadophora sp. DSE1049]|nr:hypothetical protein DL98DRAFT_595871 [Cadophora sp. DSE1049]